MNIIRKSLVWMGVIGTISTVAGILIEISELPTGNLSKYLFAIGVGLFLLDIVLTLAELRKDSQKILSLEGWNLPILNSLYKILDSPILPIKRIVETTPVIANQFINVYDNERKVTVKEPTFIYDYLKNLTAGLPSGSVWIGTSKLNLEIWNDDQSLLFDQILKRRAKEKEILIFRLFLTRLNEHEANTQQLERILNSGAGSTELRAFDVGYKNDGEDFTIILQPKTMLNKKKKPLHGPFESFKHYKPVCLIRYKIDFSSILNEIEIITDNETINQYGAKFDDLWNDNTTVTKANFGKDANSQPFTGQWRGKGIQDIFVGNKDQEFSIELNLESYMKTKIRGTFKTSFPGINRNDLVFNIEGFTINNYLYGHYHQQNPTHFGGVTIELSLDGKQLIGHYVGYGHLTNGIVKGSLSLTLVG